MKKEYITPYVTKMSCLVEQHILTNSIPINDNEGGEQWSNRLDIDTEYDWEE